MTNEVQLYSQFSDPLTAIERLGTALAKSGLFGCDRSEQGQALMLICMSEKKSPTEILRNYDIVQGRLRKKSLAMLADFRQRGGKHVWINTGDTGDFAELALEFEGSKITVRFTLADAKKQGIVKAGSAWDKTPGNMLRARCISNGVAMLCPEIVAGSEDEAENTPSPAPALDISRKPTTPAHQESPPAAIDIPITVVSRTEPPQDAANLASAGLAPSIEARPVAPNVEIPKPDAPKTSYSMTGNGEFVKPETAAVLEELIGPHFDKAMAWFVKEKWILPSESILRLTETRAKRVIAQKSSWLRAIGAEVAK